MKTFVLPLAIAAATAAMPATAANFVVTYNSVQSSLPISGNDFNTELQGLGLGSMSTASSVSVSGRSRVTYYYLGSESGQTDTFTDTNGSFSPYAENNTNNFGVGGLLIGSVDYNAAGVLGATFASPSITFGNPGFGVFLPANLAARSGSFAASSVYFGFDDMVNNQDDNHDDFIVRADISAVPEPAMWALMVVGFGLVGTATRRRNAAAVVTA